MGADMTPFDLDARYPYDPSTELVRWEATGQNLRGLDKLRACRDRSLALVMWEVHRANEKRWAIEEANQRVKRAWAAAHGETDGKQKQAGDR
jgi:hypothetical protein